MRAPFRFRAAPAQVAPAPAHSFERTWGHTTTTSDLPRTLLRPSVPAQKSPSSLPLYSVPLHAALLCAAPLCKHPTCMWPHRSRAPLCWLHCVRGQPIGWGGNQGEGGVTQVEGMGEGGRGLTVRSCAPLPLSERERAREGQRATREREAKGASEAVSQKGGERMERGTGMVGGVYLLYPCQHRKDGGAHRRGSGKVGRE